MRLIKLLNKYDSGYRLSKVYILRRHPFVAPIDRELYKYGVKPSSYSMLFHSSHIIMAIAFIAGFIYCCHVTSIHNVKYLIFRMFLW